MKLMIGGDFCVTKNFINKDLLDPTIVSLFNESDFNLLNLECPVTHDIAKNKILKTGPHLSTSPATVLPYLNKLNIDAVTLANNHILDYRMKGLVDTIDFCKKAGIETVGAGRNLEETQRPLRKSISGKLISFLNFAENEWASTKNTPGGANSLDIIDNVKLIRQESNVSDYVIVIIHGGNEYYQYPSPRIQKQYRFYVEMGADIIIGHHPHCISGYELYRNKPIIYSIGNFLFTKKSKFDVWYIGSLLELTIDKSDVLEFNLLPIKQDKKTFKLSLLKGNEKNNVIEQINTINKVIDDYNHLESKWKEFCNLKKSSYLMEISPLRGINNRILRGILYRIGAYKIFLNSEQKRQLINRLRCEAHYDVLKEVLK